MMKQKHVKRVNKKLYIIQILLTMITLVFFCISNIKAKTCENCIQRWNRELMVIPTQIKEQREIKTVVLDAGHGGTDGGSSAHGYIEKDVTLEIVKKLGARLNALGVYVVYTRESDEWKAIDESDDLVYRVAVSNHAKADLFLSIHLNKFQDETSGVETWTSFSDKRSYTFAGHIQTNLAALSYSEDRGLKNQDDSLLYVLQYNQVPAALVELGFISSRKDMNQITDDEMQKQIIEALAQAILSSL